MKDKKRADEKEAGLTIEASLGLTIFIFTVICLVMPMKMLDTQRQVQQVLEATSKELSRYAYVRYRLSRGENEISQGQMDISKELISFFTGSSAGIFLSGKIKETVGTGKIEAMDFSDTEISEDGEAIYLSVKYRLKLPFSIFRLDSIPAISVSSRRGWIGSEGGRKELSRGGKEDETMVYVGNTMGRYHLSRSCHYISNRVSSIPYDDVKDYESSSGRHYKPCSVCGKKASSGSAVYVMPNGGYYHSRKDCSSIAYYVREVPLSEVEYLGACSYCGGR